MRYGTCKLSGDTGKLVRSHLIPKALTRTPTPGEPRIEAGEGFRPIKRFDSWFDNTIVTRSGENILERYDTWAISELRRFAMIWSSWKGSDWPIDATYEPVNEEWGWRRIGNVDTKRLRLFFLSLLWRAAVTELRGFTTIGLDVERLELLRKMIVSGDPEPPSILPVTLVQLTTKGPWHSATPTEGFKTIPEEPPATVRFFRFFLDGLIVHIDDEQTDPTGKVRWGSLAVGASNDLTLLARKFDGSAQSERLEGLMNDTRRDYQRVVASIFGWNRVGTAEVEIELPQG